MSKKQFIALAETIQKSRAAFSENAINALAYFCEDQNPRFNRQRWLDYIEGKCGPNGGKTGFHKVEV